MGSARHGVVTRTQLLAAGLTPMEIKLRVRKRALLRVHRGVYRVGHRARSTEATYLAAVFAAGEGAVLSGRAAAYLWGIFKGSPPPAEVTARTERRIEGVRTRRCRHLDAQDVAVCRGVPVTSVARTVVDLAAELSLDALARICHEAGIRYGLTPTAVVAVLERRPRTRGARKLRRVVEGDVHVTLSKLEARFLKLLRNEGLPLPLTNRPAGGRRVDCRWPEHALTVELDGYRFHNSRHSWENDRRREREARARGDDFRRYTYADVFERPALMLRELHSFFNAVPGDPPPPRPPRRSARASGAASRAGLGG
jgi:hypothetical protein